MARAVLVLAWPVMAEHAFVTLMRTTDMFVSGQLSAEAVAAVGLGDVWERVALHIGLALGAGVIALVSQEIGAGRSQAGVVVGQAVLLALFLGLPFVAAGLTISEYLIHVFGAEREVVVLGGVYLRLLFVAAPFRIAALVLARCFQASGDTRTPMLVNLAANVLNIGLTVGLGLGYGPFPALGVFGIGLATAIAQTVGACTLFALVWRRPWAALRPAWPRGWLESRIMGQLLRVAAPKLLSGGARTAAEFPFNALIVRFGTEAVAAYHIARRIEQQVSAPFQRGFRVASGVLVGQNLGARRPEDARRVGWTAGGLALGTNLVIGAVLFAVPLWALSLFTGDAATLGSGVGFLRALALALPFIALFASLSGALEGAGNTEPPMYATLVGTVGGMLGVSYVGAVLLGFGETGIQAGLVMDFLLAGALVSLAFWRGGWVAHAEGLMRAREESRSNGGREDA